MTTADYVLSKIAGKTIDDTKFVTESCISVNYLNCITALLTKYNGQKVWFNSFLSDQPSLPKHLVYWDLTDPTHTYQYEIDIYTHGNSQTGCCTQNPVTQATCTGSSGVDNCISVMRSSSTINDDQVPTSVLDEAINSLLGTAVAGCDSSTQYKLPVIGCVKKEYTYIGAAVVIAFFLLRR